MFARPDGELKLASHRFDWGAGESPGSVDELFFAGADEASRGEQATKRGGKRRDLRPVRA